MREDRLLLKSRLSNELCKSSDASQTQHKRKSQETLHKLRCIYSRVVRRTCINGSGLPEVARSALQDGQLQAPRKLRCVFAGRVDHR